VSRVYPWLSILMALALALFEWVFFFASSGESVGDLVVLG
jgi:hypothetical protein